ncbi:hypothetical protein Y1Q_0019794 [Alligator mississippiensis]|uniref:Uncharacterized protein n=1 Tax=Alligator mississippiensis TaxID=8496 RepID=A0A151PF46_ALLMI|nr:hypothetical protein Y1Q_0019794 [Alligator mississippiensis]
MPSFGVRLGVALKRQRQKPRLDLAALSGPSRNMPRQHAGKLRQTNHLLEMSAASPKMCKSLLGQKQGRDRLHQSGCISFHEPQLTNSFESRETSGRQCFKLQHLEGPDARFSKGIWTNKDTDRCF